LYYNAKKIKISNGILVYGVVTKDHVGPVSGSIVQAIYNNPGIMDNSNRKGLYRAAAFISDSSKVLGAWLTARGFTFGARDCGLLNPDLDKMKSEQLIKLQALANQVGENVINSNEKNKYEQEIQVQTSNYQSAVSTQLMEMIPDENNFKIMITSKSKGSPNNFVQVAVSLGQQIFGGKRMGLHIGGNRSLPHFLKDDEDLAARGFVRSSLIKGISNTEFFFHAAASREGLIHTAVSISDIGLIHRNLSKMLEDCKIAYDGSVRDHGDPGLMIQPIVGDDGLSPDNLERINLNFDTPFSDESLCIMNYQNIAAYVNKKHGF
jgi:DNA-directed RNA polymerase II subunit RPB1